MEYKLDLIVRKLDDISDKPIFKVYEQTKNNYLEKNNESIDLGVVYDEMMYYLLTDLKDGCEKWVKHSGYKDEIELLKDVIAVDVSERTKIELSNKVQDLNMKIIMESKNMNPVIFNNLQRFVYMGFSYIDERYSEYLIDHLIKKEDFNPDDIIRFINKRLMNRKTNILGRK